MEISGWCPYGIQEQLGINFSNFKLLNIFGILFILRGKTAHPKHKCQKSHGLHLFFNTNFMLSALIYQI